MRHAKTDRAFLSLSLLIIIQRDLSTSITAYFTFNQRIDYTVKRIKYTWKQNCYHHHHHQRDIMELELQITFNLIDGTMAVICKYLKLRQKRVSSRRTIYNLSLSLIECKLQNVWNWKFWKYFYDFVKWKLIA